MAKGKGWDNAEHNQNSKKLGEAYRQNDNVRSFKREPYDAAKEKVTALIGRIPLGQSGTHIHVELSSYNGGPEGVVIRKVRPDNSSTNLGKLWGEQFNEFMALLAQADKTMKEKNAEFRAAREAAKSESARQEFVRKVVGK